MRGIECGSPCFIKKKSLVDLEERNAERTGEFEPSTVGELATKV